MSSSAESGFNIADAKSLEGPWTIGRVQIEGVACLVKGTSLFSDERELMHKRHTHSHFFCDNVLERY